MRCVLDARLDAMPHTQAPVGIVSAPVRSGRTHEQVFRGGDSSASADVYALGVIMWEMGTRHWAWEGLGFNQISVCVSVKQVRALRSLAARLFTYASPSTRSRERHSSPLWASAESAANRPRLAHFAPRLLRAVHPAYRELLVSPFPSVERLHDLFARAHPVGSHSDMLSGYVALAVS